MKKYILLFVVMSFTYGCEDFLELDVPKDQIFQESAFKEEKTAVAVMANIYTSLRNEGFLCGNTRGIGYLMGCYTDELHVTVPGDTDYKLFFHLTVSPVNTTVKNLWDVSYKQLYAVNNLLEGLERSDHLKEEVVKQLKAEALLVRGLLHFYLCQTFGSVPYVTVTDYNVNKNITRLNVDAVMQNAMNDLLEAEKLLEEVPQIPSKIRITASAVQGFLARMYLYQENWGASYQYALKVINSGLFELEPLDKVFLKDSKSAIWHFKPVANNTNTLEGTNYIFTSVPAPFAELNENLLLSFESGDFRKTEWTKVVGSSAHAYKYRQRGPTSASVEHSVVLRIEEIYLIAAEAAAEMNDWVNFNNYINLLRNRAKLEELSVADRESASIYILAERRVELFCEFGHRFFDLKRKNRLQLLSVLKPSWEQKHSLLPLPETELQLNPNLMPQNPGY